MAEIIEKDSDWEQNVYRLENEELLNIHDTDIDATTEYEQMEGILKTEFGSEWEVEDQTMVPKIIKRILYKSDSLEEFNRFNSFLKKMENNKGLFKNLVFHIFAEYLDDDYALLERLLNVVNKKQLDLIIAERYGVEVPSKNIFGVKI